MFSVAVMCAEADLSKMSTLFQAENFMREVVITDMNIGTPPVLRGRALHCVASFAQWISKETAVQCFNAAAASLSEDSPLPVRMTAARAIASLSVSTEGDSLLGAGFLRPHVGMLLQSIAKVRIQKHVQVDVPRFITLLFFFKGVSIVATRGSHLASLL